MTEFRRLVDAEFGRARGELLVGEHVMLTLGSRTAARSITDGVDPREAWSALCDEFDVPPERRLGPDE